MSNHDCQATNDAFKLTCEIIQKIQDEAFKERDIKLLNWAMSLCCTGMTPSMIRRELHNKLVEISGEGERA